MSKSENVALYKYLTRPASPELPGASSKELQKMMPTADLKDDLTPGPLKDELLKDFDPSQETHEEYLQRKNLERPFNAATGGIVKRQNYYEAGYVKPQPQKYLDQALAYYGREWKELSDGNKALIRSGRIGELLAKGQKAKMSYAETARYKDLVRKKVQQSKKAGKFESYQTLYKFLKDQGYPITQADIDAGYGKINKIKSVINKALGNPVPGKDNVYSGGLLDYLQTDPTTIAKQAKASQAAVTKTIGKQPEILEFVLNNPDTDVKDIAKKFNLKKSNTHDQLKKILTRIYVSKEPGMSTWLNSYTDEQLSTVVRNIRGLPSFKDEFEKRMTSLIQEAYKDKPRETYLKARRRYFDYSKAVRAVADKFGKAAEYNLDHIIPLDFLYKTKEGRDPMELIRVRPTTRAVNTFKSRFDRAFINIAEGIQKDPQNKTLQAQRKAFNDLSKALPTEFKLGEITPEGDFKSFKARPFSGTQSYLEATKAAPVEQNTLIDFLKANKNNPEFKDSLKKVGLKPDQYIALSEKGKLPAEKIGKFLDKEISKGNLKMFSEAIPGLRAVTEPLVDITVSGVKDIAKGAIGKGALKMLPAVGVGLGAYDAGIAIQEGKDVFEVAGKFFGVDPIYNEIKQYSYLPKDAQEIQKKLNAQMSFDAAQYDAMDEGLVGLRGRPEVSDQEQMYLSEQKKLVQETIEKENEARREGRLGLVNAIKQRIFDVSGTPYSIGFANGGRVFLKDGGKPVNIGRRKFLKLVGQGGTLLAALPFLGKYIKPATKAAPEVIEAISRSADQMPTYLTKLIEKIKMMGTSKIIGKYDNPDEFIRYDLGDYELFEGAGGARLKRIRDRGEYGYEEFEMQIKKDPETDFIEYEEVTARPDQDGKLKDIDFGIDDDIHLEMKKFADED